VGGLAHYIEEAGVATTQISLVRIHTEAIQPPRALWVPFELGRPFGTPDKPDFQKRILTAALKLLEADSGPLLEDYPEDAPAHQGEEEGWTCPINISLPAEELSGADAIEAALKDEVGQLSAWYDRALEKRGGRTTVGVSGLEIDQIVKLVADLFRKGTPDSPSDDLSLTDAIKLGTEDLKAFYTEAASAQPGDAAGAQLVDWYWGDTTAGETILKLRTICAEDDDPKMQLLGNVLLVPTTQRHRGA
jgi:hypothetical protein